MECLLIITPCLFAAVRPNSTHRSDPLHIDRSHCNIVPPQVFRGSAHPCDACLRHDRCRIFGCAGRRCRFRGNSREREGTRSRSFQDSRDGSNIVVGGVAVQLAGYLLFDLVFLSFWYRVLKDKPPLYHKLKPFMIAVLLSSIFIVLRSIYRVIEMAYGWDGKINTTEWAVYVFDGVFVLIAVVILNVYNPMHYLPKKFSWKFKPERDGPTDLETALPSGKGNKAESLEDEEEKVGFEDARENPEELHDDTPGASGAAAAAGAASGIGAGAGAGAGNPNTANPNLSTGATADAAKSGAEAPMENTANMPTATGADVASGPTNTVPGSGPAQAVPGQAASAAGVPTSGPSDSVAGSATSGIPASGPSHFSAGGMGSASGTYTTGPAVAGTNVSTTTAASGPHAANSGAPYMPNSTSVGGLPSGLAALGPIVTPVSVLVPGAQEVSMGSNATNVTTSQNTTGPQNVTSQTN